MRRCVVCLMRLRQPRTGALLDVIGVVLLHGCTVRLGWEFNSVAGCDTARRRSPQASTTGLGPLLGRAIPIDPSGMLLAQWRAQRRRQWCACSSLVSQIVLLLL
jgi:hypothetical protein